MSRVIVVSSRKGGVGKSTLTMQIGILLTLRGRSVCVLDTDYEQMSITQFLKNRATHGLIVPDHQVVSKDIDKKIAEMSEQYDVVIVDTPGCKSDLTDSAHAVATDIISVMGSSELDAHSVLGTLADNGIVPSDYSASVWSEIHKNVPLSKGKNWFLVLNRVGQSKKELEQILGTVEYCSKVFGYTIGGTLKERVAYKGFRSGVTPMDKVGPLTASQIAARVDIRSFADKMRLR